MSIIENRWSGPWIRYLHTSFLSPSTLYNHFLISNITMATGTLLLLQDRIGITKKFQKLRRHTSGSAARRISKRWQTHSSQVSTLTAASVLGPSYSYFFPQNPSLSFNFLSNSLYTKNDILFWTLEYTPRAGAEKWRKTENDRKVKAAS